MDPPQKRLRILQSLEVDEEDPEYIKAKQKQQQVFKGSLEKIFEKYGNMHESMSDEIDMRTNKVVVDRGHLRRVVRQVNRKETILLDTLGLEADKAGANLEEEEDENCEESEDELAPTKRPTSSPTLKRKQPQSSPTRAAQSPDNTILAPVPPVTATPVQIATLPATSPAGPAANLLQLVQFPQTPAGQQAQSTFYQTLAQTINQAVQQAVAPLFQYGMSNTPSTHLPFFQPQHAPATPIVPPTSDKVAPPTDPKWFFPPLPAKSNEAASTPTVPASAPSAIPVGGNVARPSSTLDTPTQRAARKPRKKPPPKTDAPIQISVETTEPVPEPMPNVSAGTELALCRRASPQVIIRQRRDMSRPKTSANKDGSNKRKKIGPAKAADQQVTSSTHLPTPSSSEYEDHHIHRGYSAVEEEGRVIPPSSSHYDDDERDLLSIAGDDDCQLEKAGSPIEMIAEEDFCPDPEEDILPSIEHDGITDEDALQQSLLANTTPQPDIKPEPQPPSPVQRHKPPQPQRNKHFPSTIPDTDASSNPSSQIINSSFSQPSQPSQPSPLTRTSSLDLVGSEEPDDLAQPTSPAPIIKREHSTPPPLLSSSFLLATPRSTRPQTHASSSIHNVFSSGGTKSLSRTEKKKLFKSVKQSWTRGVVGTPGPGMGSVRRRGSLGGAFGGSSLGMGGSMNLSAGKRRRSGDAIGNRQGAKEESEDELAM